MRFKGTRLSPLVWAAVVLFFGIAFLLGSREASFQREGDSTQRTTFSARPGGCKALYLWLKALDIKIERWQRALTNLPADAGLLLMLDPEVPPAKGEGPALNAWIRSGKTLLVAITPSNPWRETLSLESEEGSPLRKTRGAVLQPGPYTTGVRTVSSTLKQGVTSRDWGAVVHIQTSRKAPLLTVLKRGKGWVVVLSDPSIISNARLREGDNARVILNVLRKHAGQGRILIDEYHHGFGRAASLWKRLLASPLAAPSLQAGLVLVLVWASLGRRFGPARPLPAAPPGGPAAHARALGDLLRRSGATRFALLQVSEWTDEEARRLLVHGDRALQNALEKIRERSTSRVSEKELLRLARGLHFALRNALRRAPGWTDLKPVHRRTSS